MKTGLPRSARAWWKIFLRAVPTPTEAAKISTSHPFLFEDRMTVLEVKKNITQKLLQNIEKTLYE